MALIVEDGTAKPDAESFCDVATATAYHAARLNAGWAAIADDATREAYLRRASDYMEQVYREIWNGYRKTSTQRLSWPRYAVPMKDYAGVATLYGSNWAFYPDNAVPEAVRNACAELALKAASGEPLAPDVEPLVLREKIGPIETEYQQGGLPYVRYRAIDMMLEPFLSASAGAAKVIRT
jgi:hypothetical protein